ncbi:nuclear transport factor 2 family protein [candidate division WOR-3 bacterium]|nr:nuclear transport factor 2 family protein [candidate division WOR-3 bacterium]
MPDWHDAKLKDIKGLIIKYTRALNSKNYDLLRGCFSDDAALHRGMKNYVGKDEITAWNRKQLEGKSLRFELKDAIAGVFPDSTARCILWFEIYNDQVHVESIDLVNVDADWLISKCFGLGYDPEHHRENFGG